jgi:hypothetical protein
MRAALRRRASEPPPDPDDLDAQLWAINEDLALERTSLNEELAKFRPKRKKSAEARRQERWCREYFLEICPGSDTPVERCACGDVVFWRQGDTPWACRSCTPPDVRAKVQWFVC